MKEIIYLKQDATKPVGEGKKIIAHICNDVGGWGRGFVLAISKRWKEPENSYRKWYREKTNFELGQVQFVTVEDSILVANMIAQRDIKTNTKELPIRYDAAEKCLQTVAEKAKVLNASIHMPRIGCGLAGGKWEKIEPIIKQTLLEKEIEVYVYDF